MVLKSQLIVWVLFFKSRDRWEGGFPGTYRKSNGTLAARMLLAHVNF